MQASKSDYRLGATPVESRQAGEVPGSLPRKSPPQATGGASASTWGTRSGAQRKSTTGHMNAPDMLITQTIKSQNVTKPHSSGEETLWHNGRTCPDSGLHCGFGSHCLTDGCRKNEEEEEYRIIKKININI